VIVSHYWIAIAETTNSSVVQTLLPIPRITRLASESDWMYHQPTMARMLVLLLAAVTAALHLRAELRVEPDRIRWLRPLATALFVLAALLAGEAQSGIYQGSVVAGLLLALAADAATILPDDPNWFRLAAHALSQTAFILAFTGDARGVMNPWLGLPFGVYALALYLYLVPALGRRRFVVLIFILLSAVTAWAGWGRWRLLGGPETLLGAVAATLVMLASGLRLMDREGRSPSRGRLAALAINHLGHLLFAWSV
jgi:hypothetical protein